MAETKVKHPVTKGVAKVPVVMQMEALECGAASLCMVLAYYDKWVPLEQVRVACGVSRDGSSARNILRAARNYGLDTDGYRLEPEDLQEKGTFPCIIHWEFNHFLVCDGFKGGKAYLNDPARGRYAVSRERFDEAFTGVALFLKPGESFKPGGQPKSISSFIWSRLKGAESALVFVALITMIATMTGILDAGFSRVFYDQLLPGLNKNWIIPYIVGLGLLSLLKVAVAWIQAIYSSRLNGKMDAVGSASFMWKVLRLPMEFFSQRMAGDIQGRKASNASIANTVVYTLAPLVLNVIVMVFYFVVMIRYSVLLTIVGLVFVLLDALISHFISNQRIDLTRVLMRDQGNLASATVGAIDMIETIKASGAENGYFERWAGYQAAVSTQSVRAKVQDQVLGIIPNAITSIMNIMVAVLGVWLTMQGEFTVGSIVAFKGFMGSFLSPAGQLITARQNIQEMRTSMERINDVMEYPNDPAFEKRPTPQSYDKLSGALTMRNVTFGYSRLGDPVIKDFSLELKPGQRVAFVGTSGCGKSTLAKLISGLYQPWSGEILFDGMPISQIDRDVFTSSVAVVDQDIILFEDSIEDNIKMWDSSVEDFSMILAARDAKIHKDIMQRPGGYDYVLTEGGKDFSGGQRQRLEIARVLAQDPTLIIMDEATSALDAHTEFEVVNAIRERGVTTVVIAHRLSTIRDCDEIIVLDHGVVVERGTHKELMAQGGVYKTLVTSE